MYNHVHDEVRLYSREPPSADCTVTTQLHDAGSHTDYSTCPLPDPKSLLIPSTYLYMTTVFFEQSSVRKSQ